MGDADVGPDLGLALMGFVIVGLEVEVTLLYKLQIKKFLNGLPINYS